MCWKNKLHKNNIYWDVISDSKYWVLVEEEDWCVSSML